MPDAVRHYCHEVLLGRFVKLAGSLSTEMRTLLIERLSGEITNEHIEAAIRGKLRALDVVMGEITVSDLRRRLDCWVDHPAFGLRPER